MTRHVYDLIREPSGEPWRRILRAIWQNASGALLVLRDGVALSDNGRELLLRLEPHLTERRRSASWPGTELLSEEATVLRFSSNRAVLEELVSAAHGLYDWQLPLLPEDLCLIRDDGCALLGSICHEQDAFLEVSDDEYADLTAAVPELAGMVQRRTD